MRQLDSAILKWPELPWDGLPARVIFPEEDLPEEYGSDTARNAEYFTESSGYWDYNLDEQRGIGDLLANAMETNTIKQKIISFHQDEIGDWVAVLQCGHQRHVRHNPPWTNHPWVITSAGRQRFIGVEIECKACSEEKSQEAP